MASDRLRRFLNLERPRREGAEAAPPVSDRRFGSMEPPAPVPEETPVPEEATQRFREPRERPLEVARPREWEQPFIRCCRCETDNTLFAATCQSCQADLHTREQRLFNERLWAQRRREAADEAAVLAERERQRERLAAEESRARRELAAEMARREGDRVRDRLESDGSWGRVPRRGGGWGDDDGYAGDPGSRAPAGIRLLRLIRNPAARIAVAIAALGLPVLLVVAAPRGSGAQTLGMILIAALVAMVSPGRYRRRGWWGW
jgi:hypothetical protein